MSQRIFVTGNPIKEILDYFSSRIEASRVLEHLCLEAGKYFLVTLHRAENVDVAERLSNFITALHKLHAKYKIPVICSLHPRTRSQLKRCSMTFDSDGVFAIEPLGLFDFIHLEKLATCVLTDSGTVQEECCIFKVANVTFRDVTERPETIEVGSNMLSGAEPRTILKCVNTVLSQPRTWSPPAEYLISNVSSTAAKIVLGYQWKC